MLYIDLHKVIKKTLPTRKIHWHSNKNISVTILYSILPFDSILLSPALTGFLPL